VKIINGDPEIYSDSKEVMILSARMQHSEPLSAK